jgi:hypothetical protein
MPFHIAQVDNFLLYAQKDSKQCRSTKHLYHHLSLLLKLKRSKRPLRLPYFVDNWLIDGSEVVGLTLAAFYPLHATRIHGAHFC